MNLFKRHHQRIRKRIFDLMNEYLIDNPAFSRHKSPIPNMLTEHLKKPKNWQSFSCGAFWLSPKTQAVEKTNMNLPERMSSRIVSCSITMKKEGSSIRSWSTSNMKSRVDATSKIKVDEVLHHQSLANRIRVLIEES